MEKSIQVDYETWKMLKKECLDNSKTIKKYLKDYMDGKKYCVYKLELKGGKCYIGQTKNIYKRVLDHSYDKSISDVVILYTTDSQMDVLNAEKKYIAENKNCINKNYIDLSFEISEMAIFHSFVVQMLFKIEYNYTIFVTNNGYISNVNLEYITNHKNIKVDADFLMSISKHEKIEKERLIIINGNKWYHPTIALDIIRERRPDLKVKIYNLLTGNEK